MWICKKYELQSKLTHFLSAHTVTSRDLIGEMFKFIFNGAMATRAIQTKNVFAHNAKKHSHLGSTWINTFDYLMVMARNTNAIYALIDVTIRPDFRNTSMPFILGSKTSNVRNARLQQVGEVNWYVIYGKFITKVRAVCLRVNNVVIQQKEKSFTEIIWWTCITLEISVRRCVLCVAWHSKPKTTWWIICTRCIKRHWEEKIRKLRWKKRLIELANQ